MFSKLSKFPLVLAPSMLSPQDFDVKDRDGHHYSGTGEYNTFFSAAEILKEEEHKGSMARILAKAHSTLISDLAVMRASLGILDCVDCETNAEASADESEPAVPRLRLAGSEPLSVSPVPSFTEHEKSLDSIDSYFFHAPSSDIASSESEHTSPSPDIESVNVPGLIFSKPLKNLDFEGSIPLFLKKVTAQLVACHALTTRHIFITRANHHAAERQKKLCDNKGASALETLNPHVLVELLRIWLTELPEPLLPKEFRPNCMKIPIDFKKSHMRTAQAILGRIPEPNRACLNHMFHFLGSFCVPQVENVTGVIARVIAETFAPCLTQSKESHPVGFVLCFLRSKEAPGVLRRHFLNVGFRDPQMDPVDLPSVPRRRSLFRRSIRSTKSNAQEEIAQARWGDDVTKFNARASVSTSASVNHDEELQWIFGQLSLGDNGNKIHSSVNAPVNVEKGRGTNPPPSPRGSAPLPKVIDATNALERSEMWASPLHYRRSRKLVPF